MASIEEPEVQFAQRLACNEKSVRNKALKKLRKYISVRSHSHTGGFTAVELLKLWKGLFYCLWMQDKPLLQEELSRNISTLIHSFHQFDTQLLYLESFLQTVKREWTGIDRLRMDKFFQLVRFMFRQTFELLKRNSWEKGQISRFVDLLTAELLQVGSRAPSGLQLHVLDLYMSELAAVGSAELTADQNLVFIEPFCRTAAKTKDRTLFSAVCSRIFSVIIDQAPFAIQDLMKELEAAGSDSGQASEEEQDKEEKPAGKKKQHSISKSKEDIDDDDDDDDDDDEMFDSEDPDSELQDDIGPVLQFDYSAVADKLFELASRNSTPGPNRQRLYKIIKVLRDLSEGIFPQDEYPEEVSTDEDDDMFATRKKLKRLKRKGLMDPDQDDSPAAKKTKKKKTVDKQNEDSEPADVDTSHEKKKKKKKKKNKALVNSKKTENGCGGLERSQEAVLEEESSLAVKTSDPVIEESHPPQHVDQSQEDMVDPEKSSANDGPSPKKRKKKKKKKTKVALKDEAEKASVCESTAAPPKDTHSNDGEKADTEVSVVSSQAGGAVEAPLEMDLQTPAAKKKKKKGVKEAEVEKLDTEVSGLKVINDTTPVEKKEQEGARAQPEVHVNGVSSETDSRPKLTPITAKKRSKRKSVKAGNALSPPTGTDGLQKAEPEAGSSEPPQKKEQQLPEVTMTTPQQDAAQISAKQMADSMEEPAVVLSSGKTAKKKKRKIPVVIEFEADELEAAALADHAEATTPKKTPLSKDPADQQTPATIQKKKKKVSGKSQPDFISFQSRAAVPTPLFCKLRGNPETLKGSKKTAASAKPVKTRKSQVPDSGSKKVTFGLKNNKTAEFKKTDRSLLLSPDGSSRVPFDPAQKPKCGVLKSPRTRLSTSNQRSSLSIPNSTPKRQKRPAAADFF